MIQQAVEERQRQNNLERADFIRFVRATWIPLTHMDNVSDLRIMITFEDHFACWCERARIAREQVEVVRAHSTQEGFVRLPTTLKEAQAMVLLGADFIAQATIPTLTEVVTVN